MKAIKVDTSCNVSIVELKAPLYQSLDELLGGWPEHVRPKGLKHPFCMMVDDCGLLKELPFNPVGSFLYETDKHGQPIVGDIYIMKERIFGGGEYEVIGLEDKDIALLDNIRQIANALKEGYPQ